jgi:large subunit ribosomal protein L23
MAKRILLRPVITEKSDKLVNKSNKYTFRVEKSVNRLEVKAAVQEMYGVNVLSVNTLIIAGKTKSRSTKTSVLRGMTSSYKKAIVQLAEGESIDIFGSSTEQ